MKCPQCSFVCSDTREKCPRCGRDLTEFKKNKAPATASSTVVASAPTLAPHVTLATPNTLSAPIINILAPHTRIQTSTLDLENAFELSELPETRTPTRPLPAFPPAHIEVAAEPIIQKDAVTETRVATSSVTAARSTSLGFSIPKPKLERLQDPVARTALKVPHDEVASSNAPASHALPPTPPKVEEEYPLEPITPEKVADSFPLFSPIIEEKTVTPIPEKISTPEVIDLVSDAKHEAVATPKIIEVPEPVFSEVKPEAEQLGKKAEVLFGVSIEELLARQNDTQVSRLYSQHVETAKHSSVEPPAVEPLAPVVEEKIDPDVQTRILFDELETEVAALPFDLEIELSVHDLQKVEKTEQIAILFDLLEDEVADQAAFATRYTDDISGSKHTLENKELTGLLKRVEKQLEAPFLGLRKGGSKAGALPSRAAQVVRKDREWRHASRTARIGACMSDFLRVGALTVIATVGFWIMNSGNPGMAVELLKSLNFVDWSALLLTCTVVFPFVLIVYLAYQFVLNGTTPGLERSGLEIVSTPDGNRASLRALIIRACWLPISIVLSPLAALAPKGVNLHDWLSYSRVAKKL